MTIKLPKIKGGSICEKKSIPGSTSQSTGLREGVNLALLEDQQEDQLSQSAKSGRK